ncbi:hypothetical protein [Salana multivorans]
MRTLAAVVGLGLVLATGPSMTTNDGTVSAPAVVATVDTVASGVEPGSGASTDGWWRALCDWRPILCA